MAARARTWRPTEKDLREATRKKLRDVIAPGLRILFCGINPGRYSAAAGHHFAGPSNRFWRTLHAAGFTPERLSPWQDLELLRYGLGITNLVSRTTAQAAELSKEEIRAGAKQLVRKATQYRPAIVAIVGLGVYRTAFGEPDAECGMQRRLIGPSKVWLLPNPSGLNAHHQPHTLIELFRALQRFADAA